jgi:hypothetical protein
VEDVLKMKNACLNDKKGYPNTKVLITGGAKNIFNRKYWRVRVRPAAAGFWGVQQLKRSQGRWGGTSLHECRLLQEGASGLV